MSTALRSSFRSVSAIAAAIVVLGTVLFAAGAAQAHGGPYQLAIASDGAGGVVVSATYTEDQHPVGGIIDPIATAVASDGRTVGPVTLISSSEGEGLWVSAEPFMPEGEWSVTVVTTIPEPVTATTAIVVAPLAAPSGPSATAGVAPAPDAGGAATTAETASASTSLTSWLWLAAALVALIVVGGALLVYRKRIGSALQARRAPARGQ